MRIFNRSEMEGHAYSLQFFHNAQYSDHVDPPFVSYFGVIVIKGNNEESFYLFNFSAIGLADPNFVNVLTKINNSTVIPYINDQSRNSKENVDILAVNIIQSNPLVRTPLSRLPEILFTN